ncbi:MAG: hypothetical protein CL999_001915 [Methanobacteriota archaeon]|jgi:aerobic-type carbon monoxide dehydrogenase small subunit (CoxS/CutS family)|nr:hypothetical protein [Euryarchaeota archaeon]MEC7431320.1 (2Fe-2S)-binding protein [Candidatus Thermoplasmatota archaeon]MEC8362645.1 (2Fe-2S)-binding protein [Candidatus Thermoplasmatota archaeon]RAH07199.1 MAG: hypothetical protein CL999_001915 [Euryarchaeota archaeon]GIR80471.1 MAG: ferredoxin [Euryarchaeota archaeon]|tara:strand:- start:1779 stop:2345 length:567 start_codon:yes stop_codon:yes gene_type:complete
MASHPLPLAGNPPVEVWTASVNGKQVQTIIKNHDVLLDVLRDGIGSLGTKRGCDMGTCGCCTVLIDGKPRLSCMTLALEAKDRQVTTVEGLSDGHHLHPIQEMFAECGGSQCGFCTPGFLVTSAALLEANPTPTRQEAMDAIEGNLCRCTGYQQIVDSIMSASKILSEGIQNKPITEPASDPDPGFGG